ncbi:MAG: antibiotic biosynthesis monooxygenase [Pseudomonadota bacterium]
MICRYWRGWTTPENADAYEKLIRHDIMPGIAARNIPGFLRYQILRRDIGGEIEFATLIWFDSLRSIEGFVGADIEKANMPEAAQKVLKRWDDRVVHYEVLDEKDPT